MLENIQSEKSGNVSKQKAIEKVKDLICFKSPEISMVACGLRGLKLKDLK